MIHRYVMTSVFRDRLVVVAPGVAYFMMLGLMPGLAALILTYGLIADPLQVQQHFDQIRPAIPDEAADLLSAQIERAAEERSVAGIALGLLAIGILVVVPVVLDALAVGGWMRAAILLGAEIDAAIDARRADAGVRDSRRRVAPHANHSFHGRPSARGGQTRSQPRAYGRERVAAAGSACDFASAAIQASVAPRISIFLTIPPGTAVA